MKANKRVLVAPLDWGLGHATRCIPVINEFLAQGASVFIAGNGKSLTLLRQAFPKLPFLPLSGYRITYPSKGSMAASMTQQIPGILAGIAKEHRQLRQIVKDHSIDIVVSDNRYGVFSSTTKNIFITHQLNIQVTEGLLWLKPLVNKLNSFFISRFDECWIPDGPDDSSLSGILTETSSYTLPLYFIGNLSRFSGINVSQKKFIYPIIVMLSGPEPQRSIFEDMVLSQLMNMNSPALFIRGKPDDGQELKSRGQIDFKNHADADEILSMMDAQTIFISRSGYSMIMDLAVLGNKAILIPTPGQTEQEYLARHLSASRLFFTQSQKEMDLTFALAAIHDYSGIASIPKINLLQPAVARILQNKI